MTPTLIDDFVELKTSGEEATAVVVETARELELEVENVTELLQSYDKTWMDEELLIRDEQSIFLRYNLSLLWGCEGCWNDNIEFRINII